MTKVYDYERAMFDDIKDYIEENDLTAEYSDPEELYEYLYDELWAEDSVTGNGSESYTFDRAEAREYVLSDPETLRDALEEFCVPADTIAEKFLAEDWEYFDVTIRCWYLGAVISAVIDSLYQ